MTEQDLERMIAKTPGWSNPQRRAMLAQLRYRRQSDTRLAQINRDRSRRGLAPHASLAQAATRVPV